ncbi:uncharacterized protein LOC124286430 [Haliotis rubra]|uniref:uncharacterized protein LOC124286430 n=1 Tax=Haliotis rubra TaxID=36100 RepID=UPI001EE5F8A0|nr:uncharacterized protein LOC124286430 [Haliotis rubra]
MTLIHHPMSASVLLILGVFVPAASYVVLPAEEHADARDVCIAINQKLLTVQSLEEKATLDAFMSSSNMESDPWIDVTYDSGQGKHILTSGQPITWSDWLNVSAPLEPRDEATKRCVKVERNTDNTWLSTYCHDIYLTICGELGVYFNLSVVTYTEAKAACAAQGSVVAKVQNQVELEAFIDVLNNASTIGLPWLGIEFNDTGYVFSDGSDVTWFKWKTLDFREPEGLSWKLCVVYDHQYRGWKAEQCTRTASVICQEKKVTPNYRLLAIDADLPLAPSFTIVTKIHNKCAMICYDQSCTHFTVDGEECRLYYATGTQTWTPLVGATLWIEGEQL